jgi:hypothetical protein
MWVVSFTTRPLYPLQRAYSTHWIGCWMRPRTWLDGMKKRKICLCRESNPSTRAHSYNDWSIQEINVYPFTKFEVLSWESQSRSKCGNKIALETVFISLQMKLMKSRRFCIHAIPKTGKNIRSSMGNESSKTKGPTSACKYFFCIFCIMRIPFSFSLYNFSRSEPPFCLSNPSSFIFDSLPVEHVP